MAESVSLPTNEIKQFTAVVSLKEKQTNKQKPHS